MRSRAVSLALMIAVLLLPAAADAKWTEVRSANFLFVGDAPEGQIRRIAQKLEQFREVMLRALPGATSQSAVPTVVMVFATKRSLQPVAPLFRGNAIELAGFFQGGEDLNYVAVDAEYIDQALLTIFHEYSHFLVSNTVGGLPPWASEGLAEVYEMIQDRDGGKKAAVGLAPGQHIGLLQNRTLIPIRELMAVDHGSPVYNEGNRRGVFYAQSWALVHYLSFGNPARAKQFAQYLSSVRSGTEPTAAFATAFGADTATLDRELFEYVRQHLFPGIMFDFGAKVAASTVPRGRTIDDLEADIYVADLQSRVGRVDEARTRLAAVLKRKPDAARATASLGLQHFRARELDKALPLLEQAAGQGLTDAWVQIAYGRALIARLGEELDTAAADATLQESKTVLSRAVELDPESAFAAGMLGYVELASNGDLVRATSLLERAVRLAPSRDQYRVFLAQSLLRQKELEKATNTLGPLVASGRDPQLRAQARELLGRIADLRSMTAASASAAVAGGAPPTRQELADLSRLAVEAASSPSAPGTPATPATPISPATPATRASEPPQPAFRPYLRPVGAGETRVLGDFSGVECVQGSIALVVRTSNTTLLLRAKQLSEVDFISYRTDTPQNVSCGPLAKPPRVLATYRARADGGGAIAGDAVAIELLPDNYTPK